MDDTLSEAAYEIDSSRLKTRRSKVNYTFNFSNFASTIFLYFIAYSKHQLFKRDEYSFSLVGLNCNYDSAFRINRLGDYFYAWHVKS